MNVQAQLKQCLHNTSVVGPVKLMRFGCNQMDICPLCFRFFYVCMVTSERPMASSKQKHFLYKDVKVIFFSGTTAVAS